MFNRSRCNLARWFTLSMGSILILFAGAVYYLRVEEKLESTDRLLYQKSRVIAASVQHKLSQNEPQVDLQAVPFLGNGLQPLDTELVYVRWYDAQRRLQRFFGMPPAERLVEPSGFLTLKTQEGLDGTEIWLRQVTLPVQEGNLTIGYLQAAMPLTNTQAELQQLQLILTLTLPIALILVGVTGWQLGGMAMQPIRQAYTQLQRFTADASHELRSPLSAILTNAQAGHLMASKHPEIQPSLENIIDSTRSMNTLVNNLLLLSRHQGQLPPESLKPIFLNSFLEPLAVIHAAQAATQGVNFVSRLTERPLRVEVEPDLLRQAIENLLSNACKYTPPGGTVSLRLEAGASKAVIQVVDTGIGISAADLPHIFDRFYRVDAERTRESGGFGLGLAIVEQIVLAHGGQINATSVEGKGSVFQVELPLLL